MVHAGAEDARTAMPAQSVVDHRIDVLRQHPQQRDKQPPSQLVHRPATAGQKAVQRREVLRAAPPARDLDHSRDTVAALAEDPAADQRDEVLKAGRGKATSERLENDLQ